MDKQPEAMRLAELENMHERGTIRRGHIDEMLTELRRLHALNAELLADMKEARHALQFANESPNGGINDTIWMMDRPETLFDFMDAAIAKAKEQT